MIEALMQPKQKPPHGPTQPKRRLHLAEHSLPELGPTPKNPLISPILPQEFQVAIFRYGFTTKENGHGFGLHSSANGARELGGDLRAESEGAGTGASFILELPIGGK